MLILSSYSLREKEQLGPVKEVNPMEKGILQIIFDAGGKLEVPMQAQFVHARFSPLKEESVFQNVDTNGRFIYWYRDGMKVVEMGWLELVELAVGKRWM